MRIASDYREECPEEFISGILAICIATAVILFWVVTVYLLACHFGWFIFLVHLFS